MKLEFNNLNSLLHAALTYLCDDECIIPGGAHVPAGTEVHLELSWPQGEQPVTVHCISLGLDPAGRGLLLDIKDPGGLHQVIMIMTHLHFGPFVGRQLLDIFGLHGRSASELPKQSTVLAAQHLEFEPPSDEGLRDAAPDTLRTELPSRILPTELPERSGVHLSRPAKPIRAKPIARPPRLRPPVLRPPAANTELPRFPGRPDEPIDLTATSLAIGPELRASLDDLDDDY
jgi:hypothetical protein